MKIARYGKPTIRQRIQRLLNPKPRGWVTLGIPLKGDLSEEEQ